MIKHCFYILIIIQIISSCSLKKKEDNTINILYSKPFYATPKELSLLSDSISSYEIKLDTIKYLNSFVELKKKCYNNPDTNCHIYITLTPKLIQTNQLKISLHNYKRSNYNAIKEILHITYFHGYQLSNPLLSYNGQINDFYKYSNGIGDSLLLNEIKKDKSIYNNSKSSVLKYKLQDSINYFNNKIKYKFYEPRIMLYFPKILIQKNEIIESICIAYIEVQRKNAKALFQKNINELSISEINKLRAYLPFNLYISDKHTPYN